MKKFAAIAVLIVLGAGVFFLIKSRPATPAKPAGEPAAVSAVPPAAARVAPGHSAVVPAVVSTNPGAGSANPSAVTVTAPKPAAMAISPLPPLTVLDNARVAINHYGATFGGNPVGTNAEITQALMGKNPKGINFITAESGLRVNENGELVDAWGTPFFFHQLSGREMEIHSAGADRKMWTSDDLVTR